MPLIDQNGNKLRLQRPRHYEVKIVASRREIVWSDETEEAAEGGEDSKEELETKNENSHPQDREISVEKSYRTKPENVGRNQNKNGSYKTPLNNKKKPPGKLLKSKSDDEISRRKISRSSFTILSSRSNNSERSPRRGKSGGDRRRRSVNYTNPVELDRSVAEDMAAVSSRTIDLMISEMRKLDRDRDRVLIAPTVETTLDKYRIPLKPEGRDVLLGRFEDNTDFPGMINYEELVRYLEERRLQGGRGRGSKGDNFVLYETEHDMAKYRRNKSWTNSMEDRLVSDLKKDIGGGDGSLTLSHLADRLHEKDTYSHHHVSSPHLRSVLRALSVTISPKPLSGIMKASDLDNKGSHSIPVVLDIMSKVL